MVKKLHGKHRELGPSIEATSTHHGRRTMDHKRRSRGKKEAMDCDQRIWGAGKGGGQRECFLVGALLQMVRQAQNITAPQRRTG